TLAGSTLGLVTVADSASLQLQGAGVANIAASPAGATEAGNTATITTTVAHGFVVGNTVQIAGGGVAGYDGTFVITRIPTPTTFPYTNSTAGLAASGGGTTSRAINIPNPLSLPGATFDTANATGSLENVSGNNTVAGNILLPTLGQVTESVDNAADTLTLG